MSVDQSAGVTNAGPRMQSSSEVKTPMQEVENKVAFITGGASGIGLGIAEAFVGAGMKVVIADANEDRIREALAHFANRSAQVYAIRVDVTDRAAMQEAANEAVKVFGKIHVLVNNAGVIIPRTLTAISYKDWDWMINVNITGVFNGVHTFLPLIRSHGEGGQIITTASILGLLVWGGAEGAYTVAKFAVVAMMESLRYELRSTNIGTSVLCPGWVSTNLGASSHKAYPGDPLQAGFVQAPPPATERDNKAAPEAGLFMDPSEVGQLVLRGMRNNDLFILTHPEWERMMRDRHELLMASLPTKAYPNSERLAKASKMTQSSIYVSER